jgi:hypothetical protein
MSAEVEQVGARCSNRARRDLSGALSNGRPNCTLPSSKASRSLGASWDSHQGSSFFRTRVVRNTLRSRG